MGLFMSLSGVVGASNEGIESVLEDYLAQNKGQFEFCEVGTLEDTDIGVITKDLANTTIVYPGDFMEWDELSCVLSEKLSVPVFSFHIHDGDFWMYKLFHGGREVDQFLPVPEYWGEIDPEEEAAVKGNAKVLAAMIPNLDEASVKDYLVEWDIEALGENKAYPDDEFTIGNCWQISDFMKKAGLELPIDNNGHMTGKTFTFIFKENKSAKYYKQSSESTSTKPWWKFW